MQEVSHPGEVDPQALLSCSYAAQHLWRAALQSEERREHFVRGGSQLYTISAAPERAVQATIVTWPCGTHESRAERWRDTQRWALCLRGAPAHATAPKQPQADVKCKT